MHLDEILRSINLLLTVLVLAWLFLRRVLHPKWYPRGGLRRDIWVMALCWDLALLVGTFEQLAGTGTYVRVVISMAAVLTTLAILVRPKEDWPTSKDPADKSSR
jgi:hypothetical protein